MSVWVLIVVLAYFAVISVVLSIIDIRTHRLPNAIVLPSYIVVTVLLALACLAGAPWTAFVGSIAAGALLFCLFYLLRMVPGGGMGGGDVKLAGVIGLLLGFLGTGAVVVGVATAFVLGGVFALCAMVMRRTDRRARIAFGPFLLIGAWCGIASGLAPVMETLSER